MKIFADLLYYYTQEYASIAKYWIKVCKSICKYEVINYKFVA